MGIAKVLSWFLNYLVTASSVHTTTTICVSVLMSVGLMILALHVLQSGETSQNARQLLTSTLHTILLTNTEAEEHKTQHYT